MKERSSHEDPNQQEESPSDVPDSQDINVSKQTENIQTPESIERHHESFFAKHREILNVIASTMAGAGVGIIGGRELMVFMQESGQLEMLSNTQSALTGIMTMAGLGIASGSVINKILSKIGSRNK